MRKLGNLLRKQCQKAPRSFVLFLHCCSRCDRKYLKDSKNNKLLLASEICTNSCPWTLSVPQSSQLPSSNCSLLRTDNILGQLSVHNYFLTQSSSIVIVNKLVWSTDHIRTRRPCSPLQRYFLRDYYHRVKSNTNSQRSIHFVTTKCTKRQTCKPKTQAKLLFSFFAQISALLLIRRVSN